MERRQREAIYVRGFVKRGGASIVSQGSRTSPSPSASVDLAHLPLDPFAGSVVASNRARKVIPLVEGSSPSRVISAKPPRPGVKQNFPSSCSTSFWRQTTGVSSPARGG